MGEERVCAIRKEFLSINFTVEDDETAVKCVSLCAEFGIEPEEFVSKWELFYLNMQMDGVQVTRRNLYSFEQFLEKDRVDSYLKKQTGVHFYTNDDVDTMLFRKEETEKVDESLLRTPHKEMISPAFHIDSTELTPPPLASKNRGYSLYTPAHAAVTSSDTPFARRANKFAVQSTFNDHLPFASSEEAVSSTDGDGISKHLKSVQRCELDIVETGPEPRIRHMLDRIENRFGAVDRRIQNFAKVLEEELHRKLDDHVALASQVKVLVVGRLCCEGEGHLYDNAVLLEGSMERSNGQRVRLDLRNIPKFSFFPGQIIGVEGHNPSGFCLVATRIFDSIALPSSASLESGESAAKRRIASQEHSIHEIPHPTRIIAAAGPFTTNDNLAYEPLAEVLAYARKVRPNLLILMGPFVDLEHPQIKLGAVGRLHSHVFQKEIRMRVEKYCEEMGKCYRVVLVPSHRDSHHDLMFPQISLLPNPGILKVNEVTAGICTTDILRHLSNEEVSRVPQGASSDRMTRLASHLLAQRSFYPLFPPAQSVPLDLTVAPASLDLPCSPDIMLLSSDLAPSVKVVMLPVMVTQSGGGDIVLREEAEQVRSVCIIPGHTARGMCGGTFTEIYFSGRGPGSKLEPLYKRLQVKIIRV